MVGQGLFSISKREIVFDRLKIWYAFVISSTPLGSWEGKFNLFTYFFGPTGFREWIKFSVVQEYGWGGGKVETMDFLRVLSLALSLVLR